MTNNSATYAGFPTRWLLAITLALTGLIYPLVHWRSIDATVAELPGLLFIYVLFALACGWLANRAQLQRNLRDQSFFLIVGYLLTRLIDTVILLLNVLIFSKQVPNGLIWQITLNGVANFSPPAPLLVVQLLAGVCLLPAGRREPCGYPSFASAWLWVPMAVLPPLLFLLYFAKGGALTLALALTGAGAGAAAVLGLRWLVESFLFFRRLEHILLFLPLGLLLGYFLEWLVFVDGAGAISLLLQVGAHFALCSGAGDRAGV